MRYWEACEAQVTAAEAIKECRKHGITAVVRETDSALIDKDTGEVISVSVCIDRAWRSREDRDPNGRRPPGFVRFGG